MALVKCHIKGIIHYYITVSPSCHLLLNKAGWLNIASEGHPQVLVQSLEAGITPQSAMWKLLSKVIVDQRSHLWFLCHQFSISSVWTCWWHLSTWSTVTSIHSFIHVCIHSFDKQRRECKAHRSDGLCGPRASHLLSSVSQVRFTEPASRPVEPATWDRE